MQHLRISFVLGFAAACSSSNVSSTADAQRAYVGLDGAIGKAIQLGFDGFNAASSANIPTETGSGDASGTITVTGQVDQGASSNKTMRLAVALAGYSDGDVTVDNTSTNITYDTGSAAPALDLDLMNIPTGTLSGSLAGTYTMSGDLTGTVALDLQIDGTLQAGSGSAVERGSGTTITGTAVSDSGTYDVDVTL